MDPRPLKKPKYSCKRKEHPTIIIEKVPKESKKITYPSDMNGICSYIT